MLNEHYILNDIDKIEEVLSTLHSLGVKITAFTVGEIIEQYPDTIKLFEKYGCEFEPHSYSHDFDNPDSESELIKSKSAYVNYFKRNPLGYRAPRGKISSSGINNLEKQGFSYDSSVFPSFFPNPFKYLLSNRKAHYYGDSNILEIPITSVSPFRMTLSISYIKLLGLNFFKFFNLPDVVCFGSHLHDFIFNGESLDRLPLIWRLIYSRNKYRGIELCMRFLEHVKRKGYKFCYMSEIYDAHKK